MALVAVGDAAATSRGGGREAAGSRAGGTGPCGGDKDKEEKEENNDEDDAAADADADDDDDMTWRQADRARMQSPQRRSSNHGVRKKDKTAATPHVRRPGQN